jgi:hypothetical protein
LHRLRQRTQCNYPTFLLCFPSLCPKRATRAATEFPAPAPATPLPRRLCARRCGRGRRICRSDLYSCRLGPSSLGFQALVGDAVSLTAATASLNKGVFDPSSSSMDLGAGSSEPGWCGGGAGLAADFGPPAPPPQRRLLQRCCGVCKAVQELLPVFTFRRRRQWLEVSGIHTGAEDGGRRVCFSPSTVSSGGYRSGVWRWLRGFAPADVPQSGRLRFWRATPEVHKAANQRGSPAGLGSYGSSSSLLPVIAPVARKVRGATEVTRMPMYLFLFSFFVGGPLCKVWRQLGFQLLLDMCVCVLVRLCFF